MIGRINHRHNGDLAHVVVALLVGIATFLIGCRLVHAAGPGSQPLQPDQQAAVLIDMLMTGKYIPAVGAALCIVVAVLRGGLGAVWPWFRTRAGGYSLGFGSAALLYLGTAMEAGQVSIGVAFAALGAGWAAAGGWEHAKDVFTWLRPTPPAEQQPVSSAIHAALALAGIGVCMLIGGLTISSCKGSRSPTAVVIDCAGGSGTGVVADVLSTLDAWAKPEPDGCRLASGFDWSCIEHRALAKGEQVGGCALAELVQSLTGGTRAAPIDESWLARAALENARGHWGGAVTWRTAGGQDL